MRGFSGYLSNRPGNIVIQAHNQLGAVHLKPFLLADAGRTLLAGCPNFGSLLPTMTPDFRRGGGPANCVPVEPAASTSGGGNGRGPGGMGSSGGSGRAVTSSWAPAEHLRTNGSGGGGGSGGCALEKIRLSSQRRSWGC